MFRRNILEAPLPSISLSSFVERFVLRALGPYLLTVAKHQIDDLCKTSMLIKLANLTFYMLILTREIVAC